MSKAVANLTQLNETITFSAQDNGETINVKINELARGPAGADGPNSVTSATTSDGTANLSLSNVTTATATVTGTLTADHIHGNLAGSVYAHVRAGEALSKGDPVYVSGSHGTGANLIAIVSKADASDPLKMPAVGVMDAAVTANASGHMVITGTISDINTATYSVNAELYVAEGGGFTATPPSAYAQPVARVERSNTNNGAVIVKVNGLSAISPTASTLVRRDSSGVSDFNTINLGDLHTGGSPSAPYGSIGKSVLTGSSGVGISGNPDVALEAATHRLTLSSSGIALTSGNITTSQPLSLTQTWNAGAITFKGIDVNITDTASNAASLLMDLRVGGNPYFSIEKDGSTRLYRTYSSSTNFERLNFKYTGTAFQIGTEKGSAGGTARPLEFQTDGTTRVIIGADGVFTVDGVKVGRGAGAVSSNTALGNLALNVNTTGSSNTAIGNGALFKNTTGIINTAVGSNALPNNTTGSNNSAVGSGALLTNSTGSNNSAVGSNSLFSNTTGSNNVALGNTAGRYIADGSTANAVTTNSLYIGADTKALASGQTNQIVIGHNAIGIGTNTVVLGNDSIATTALKGSVGIGTTTPASKLTITGGDAEVTDSASGIILKSPDGTRYRITVANGGTLTVTAV